MDWIYTLSGFVVGAIVGFTERVLRPLLAGMLVLVGGKLITL